MGIPNVFLLKEKKKKNGTCENDRHSVRIKNISGNKVAIGSQMVPLLPTK
jgi:hypothetical protein